MPPEAAFSPPPNSALKGGPEGLPFEGVGPDGIVADSGGIDEAPYHQGDMSDGASLPAILLEEGAERPLGNSLDQPAEASLQLGGLAGPGIPHRVIGLARCRHVRVAQLDRTPIDYAGRSGRALHEHRRGPAGFDAAA